jgi:anthranilate synthase component 1
VASRFRVRPIGHRAADTDPADAFVALFGGARDAVWLDAGPAAASGRSILGTGTRVATYSVARREVTVRSPRGTQVIPGTMVGFLGQDLAGGGHRVPEDAFPLGWTGWLGYESGAVELGVPIPDAPVEPDAGVDAAMLFLDRAVVFDHARGSADLVWLEDDGDAANGSGGEHGAAMEAWALTTATTLASCSGAASAFRDAHPLDAHPVPARWRHDDATYLSMIASCQDAIRNGDAYQLCLTNSAAARSDADPLAVHLRLREASPAHHGGFLRVAGESLVSSSPEQFLAVTRTGLVRTRPIKGTRPRGATVARDLELRADLESSEKERAENVMIVDLMRNDLARVCDVGTVEVHDLLSVESYAQVHQLVSTVQGRLAAGRTALDAVAACFPAGSMTGAPKISAMRILGALEKGRRGVYAGCFGYFGLDGSADLAMVIRSIHLADGRVTIGAGGGITALSDPREELEEVRVKARALFAAAGLEPSGNGSTDSNV